MEFVKVYKVAYLKSVTPVFITSETGAAFLAVRPGKKFTLPRGRFIIYGKYERIQKEHFNEIKTPSPEKGSRKPKIKIYLVNNPNKLSIDIKTGAVYADRKFFNSLNKIQKRFVIAHELGHYKYFDEHKADTFAALLLRKYGYNDTQIIAAINSTLSPLSQDRKQKLYNLLKTSI